MKNQNRIFNIMHPTFKIQNMHEKSSFKSYKTCMAKFKISSFSKLMLVCENSNDANMHASIKLQHTKSLTDLAPKEGLHQIQA